MKTPNSKRALKVYGIPFKIETPQPSKTEKTKQIKAILMSRGMEKKSSFILLFLNISTITNKTISKTIISNGFGIKCCKNSQACKSKQIKPQKLNFYLFLPMTNF